MGKEKKEKVVYKFAHPTAFGPSGGDATHPKSTLNPLSLGLDLDSHHRSCKQASGLLPFAYFATFAGWDADAARQGN